MSSQVVITFPGRVKSALDTNLSPKERRRLVNDLTGRIVSKQDLRTSVELALIKSDDESIDLATQLKIDAVVAILWPIPKSF